jgi:hypothetical protein
VCRYHNAIAVESSGERVLVAIADPTDDGALQEIRDELGRQIELVVATTSEIRGALDELFGAGTPAPAPAEGTPAVSAITPIGDLGLRIAVPPPAEEAEPEAVAETVVEPVAEAVVESEPEPEAAPEPVVAAVPEPEPEPAPAEPVVTPLPDPVVHAEPEPATDPEPDPEAPAAPETPAPAAPVPSLESITSSLLDPVPSPPEPTIERNEAAHVSVAFNAPPVVEPEPAAAPPAPAEPEPVAAAAPAPVAEAAEQRPAPTDAPYCLVLNLVDGEQVDVAYFAESEEATAAARALVAGITRDAEWPQVDRTFYPPERIASVEIRERQRFPGNAARAGWGGGDPPTPAA